MAGNRITKDEYNKRVRECYQLRFESSEKFGVKDWLEYCHNNYSDKSEQTYTKIWADAGSMFEEHWKLLLEKHLTEGVHEILRLMADENPKVRADAVKMLFKYTGNDIMRQEIKATVEEIKIGFGQEE